LQAAFDRLIQPVSHDSRRVFHPLWTGLTRPTRCGRAGSSASRSSHGITLVVLVAIAIGIYVGAFVILSPMMG
jgi:ABC-type nitrate/sulfonate/bicarbonate transport system permease component